MICIKPDSLTMALVILVAAGGPTPSRASDWYHAVAPMGQYEGFQNNATTGAQVSYGCAGFYSMVTFIVEGLRKSVGHSVVWVDGEEILSGDSEFAPTSSMTSLTSHVDSNSSSKKKNEHNTLIRAISTGSEMSWITPSGDTFIFDLTGSDEILNCEIY